MGHAITSHSFTFDRQTEQTQQEKADAFANKNKAYIVQYEQILPPVLNHTKHVMYELEIYIDPITKEPSHPALGSVVDKLKSDIQPYIQLLIEHRDNILGMSQTSAEIIPTFRNDVKIETLTLIHAQATTMKKQVDEIDQVLRTHYDLTTNHTVDPNQIHPPRDKTTVDQAVILKNHH